MDMDVPLFISRLFKSKSWLHIPNYWWKVWPTFVYVYANIYWLKTWFPRIFIRMHGASELCNRCVTVKKDNELEEPLLYTTNDKFWKTLLTLNVAILSNTDSCHYLLKMMSHMWNAIYRNELFDVINCILYATLIHYLICCNILSNKLCHKNDWILKLITMINSNKWLH